MALLHSVLADDPDNGDAHLLLGMALAGVPKRAEALQELQKAVSLEPRSAVAYFSLGSAEARFADLEEAREALERATELDPGFVAAEISLALVLAQQKQLDAAREHLNKAISLLGKEPAAAHAHYLLAQVLTDQGHPRQALKEYNAATALLPGYSRAYLGAGLIKKRLHDDGGALQAFQKAAELSPDDVEAEYELGGAYLRLGMAREAVEPLHRTVEKRPTDRKAVYQLCEALRQAGKKQEAEVCAEKLSAIVREENLLNDNLATAGRLNNQGVELEKAGNVPAALDKYRTAVKLDPSQSVFRRNFALALCRLGRWSEGIAQLRTVLRQNPEDTEATKALYIALDRVAQGQNSAATSAPGSKPARR